MKTLHPVSICMREKILELKKQNPVWGYKRIAKKLGCSHNTVKYHLLTTVRKTYATRQQERRAMVMMSLKMLHGGCCVKCGYSKAITALQFHHRDPSTKVKMVSQLIREHNFTAAQEEADKCDLLCANCHFEVHEQADKTYIKWAQPSLFEPQEH